MKIKALFGGKSVIFLFSFFLISCAATKLTSVYKDPSYAGGSIKSVLVVGVADNIRNRKLFEDAFVNQFKSRGIEAVSNLTAIPKNMELTKEYIKETAERLKMDSVLVTHLVSVKEEEVLHSAVILPDPVGYHQFGTYFEVIYSDEYIPEHSTQHQFVKLQNNLYETKTEKLIWSATSEIMDPESVREIIESLGKVIMKDLQKNNLIE